MIEVPNRGRAMLRDEQHRVTWVYSKAKPGITR